MYKKVVLLQMVLYTLLWHFHFQHC